ncbi:MAG: hypothetical protein OEY01_15865 [Desulfobulbaceae bacterium]|nr:hypothetical protein [Desulfobulbaceae bacterium]
MSDKKTEPSEAEESAAIVNLAKAAIIDRRHLVNAYFRQPGK